MNYKVDIIINKDQHGYFAYCPSLPGCVTQGDSYEETIAHAKEAEKMLLQAGFHLERTVGSHRIYMKGGLRQVVLFHAKKALHLKIVKQIINILEQAEDE